ncbi:MAG: D-alanyl-D-alanine carboxypeptidase [Clostridia bacterium]|nr:D-alanyl-D-alanine carboxypeptidase [Clostridia bacterium]
MKRLLPLVLCLLLVLPLPLKTAEAQGSISAQGAVLIEAASGRLLYRKNETQRLPMASTTKIMTALLALEQGQLQDVITVPAEAAGVEGSSLYLSAGEQLTLEDLLYGLLMASGNDAAVAIALYVDGSVAAFAQRMNERAAALGCTDTHFVTPNGLHDPEHYTTALDLSRIAAAAMQNATFQKMVSTQRYTTTSGSHRRTFTTKNKVLTQIEGGCGIKTGYTKKAGRCLCFAARREGMLLIGTVLHAPDMWNDARLILEEGFSHYRLEPLLPGGQSLGQVAVMGSEKKALPVAAKQDILYPVKTDGSEGITRETEIFESLQAPVSPGQQAGECRLFVNGTLVNTVPLYTFEGADKRTWSGIFRQCMEAYLTA